MNTSFGETLRAAREAKGLTTSQIASKTRMLVQIVEEMENEDFHRIAAPIYGRGFVKLYAECVDLDPLPLVKEFMDIYEGRRAPIVRTREVPVQEQSATPEPQPAPEPPQESPPVAVAPPPEPAPEPPPVMAPPPISTPFTQTPEPEPEPIPEPPPVEVPPPAPATVVPPPVTPESEPVQEVPSAVRGLELFDAAPSQPQAPVPAAPAPETAQPPASRTADIFADSPYLTPESTFGGEGPSAADRFRKSLSSVSHGVIQSVREIPRSVWRITILIIASLVLLALLAWGCIKLYQAISITPGQQPQENINTPQDPNQEINDFKSLKDSKDPKAAKVTQPTAKTQPKAGPETPQAAVKTAPKTPEKAAGKSPEKVPSKPAKRPPLRSTGQKVPTLYAD